MNSRPRIGITGPERGGFPAWFFAALAVWRAGGRPVRITPKRSKNMPADLKGLDGLVIGGGADIDPGLYGQEHRDMVHELDREKEGTLSVFLRALIYPLIYIVRRIFSMSPGHVMDPVRDELETSLLSRMVEESKPVLGICRGAQLLNVHFGGSLHQDLEKFYTEAPRIESVFPRKWIRVTPNSSLAGVLGPGEHRVNALHRQAVDRLGLDIRAVAHEENSVIQAVEHAWMPVMGVQWHPEYMPQVGSQQNLFRHLVQKARMSSDSA